jgi:hypothetical protein
MNIVLFTDNAEFSAKFLTKWSDLNKNISTCEKHLCECVHFLSMYINNKVEVRPRRDLMTSEGDHVVFLSAFDCQGDRRKTWEIIEDVEEICDHVDDMIQECFYDDGGEE